MQFEFIMARCQSVHVNRFLEINREFIAFAVSVAGDREKGANSI